MSLKTALSPLPATQRAAVITTFGSPYTLTTTHPVPEPKTLASNQCLIKMAFAGCCHSDLHVRKGEWPGTKDFPVVAGHEGIGEIVAVGSEGGVDIGDRVGVKWCVNSCARCELCRSGDDSCEYIADGTFAEYMVAWTNNVIPIPPSVSSPEAVSVLCAGLTVYSALKKTNTTVGNWVVVPGAGGGLGHLAIQFAVAMGLRVLAIDTGAEKKAVCLASGAEHFIDFKEFPLDAESPAGPVTPVAKEIIKFAYNESLWYLRPKGTLVTVGMPTNFVLGSLRIVGSSVGSFQDATEALDLLARGKVKVHATLRRLEEINEIFDEMEAGTLVGRMVIKL
ncbi:mannitol-1-phosphate dehydrogenase M1PDH1 [Stereum hirsutum FP-91666 SS1]|uniref:mannitol-1-phosphate dehydrogenase M1PDH1 n=1 Tax=Stereum hirsutum (strain FP-91666) TaxID=721885 RepID=UPI00044496EC|nr:mannitol-1-phosphate dehydrogenase M1PDH1 [Stereum hirsutum FP-91666 SS1]EIM81787.1 mannitol-1-phosphate dehydrogenase M1PDH1 [Stereum hirsutum FP-91666 SS1]